MSDVVLKRWEALILGILLGAVPPLVGFLAGWWGSFRLLPARLSLLGGVAGLLAGLIVDAIWLRRWVRGAFATRPALWMAIYLFYTVCVFGFFMGVPAFNVLLGVPAGFFLGSRLAHAGAGQTQVRRAARRAGLFTTGVMALVCGASAFLALIDPFTGANLRGMFNLNFEVTRAMIVGLILAGGAVLLGSQWWLTRKSVEITYSLAQAAS